MCHNDLDSAKSAWNRQACISGYRLAKMQEARDQLQQDLSRQLATSEAKVASLQTLLDKSEHRAASLELQLKTRAASDSGEMFHLNQDSHFSLKHIIYLQQVHAHMQKAIWLSFYWFFHDDIHSGTCA